MRAWLAAERADVVHAFMLNPSLWSLLAVRTLRPARRPALVASERDTVIGRSVRQRWLQRLAYRGADAVTANAAPAVEAIVTRLGVPRGRVHYVPNGIDLAAWDLAARGPCPLAREPGRFHLALIGRLEPQKNHALLIEALRRIEPARRAGWLVWCVGAETGGRAFARDVEERARAAGLTECVRFVPPTPGVPALMRALDLLVLPSRHEGFPNVVLEAMASRVPVVASRVGDVPSLLEDGRTGFVFESEDADGLAHALLRASALAPAAREALVERARAVVEERYGIDAVAATHARLYESLARRRDA
jgi:glycosyltransferase involved in cell wall biosynthesis